MPRQKKHQSNYGNDDDAGFEEASSNIPESSEYDDDYPDLEEPDEEDLEDLEDEEEDFNDGSGQPADFDFAGDASSEFDSGMEMELSSEELAMGQKLLDSDIRKGLLFDINAAPLSKACKNAFRGVVNTNYSRDVFLSFVRDPQICKLNLRLALEHVILSSSADDVATPEFLQIKSNMLENWGFIISRSGKERLLQGLKRAEQRTGTTSEFNTPRPPEKRVRKSFFRR
jgi:hypothetical protein